MKSIQGQGLFCLQKLVTLSFTVLFLFNAFSSRQSFSTLGAHWNHLESFKNYRSLDLTPRGSHIIGLGCGLDIGIFKSSPVPIMWSRGWKPLYRRSLFTDHSTTINETALCSHLSYESLLELPVLFSWTAAVGRHHDFASATMMPLYGDRSMMTLFIPSVPIEPAPSGRSLH